MHHIVEDRRTTERRCSRGGGRRLTDRLPDATTGPLCPTCRKAGAAVLAGESDGGWWFVCLACDHLWDQRQVATAPAPDSPVFTRDRAFVLETQGNAAASVRLTTTVMSWLKAIGGS